LGAPDEGEVDGAGSLERIENGGADQLEEMMALDALCGAVPLEMVPTIAKKEMAKDAWDTIATMRVGDDRVKKVTVQQLRRKFDLITFDDGETIEDYALCLSSMAVHLTTPRRGGEGWRDCREDASIPAASLQADHDQDITRCVDYVCCRFDRG
jgi:hypothetical protein